MLDNKINENDKFPNKIIWTHDYSFSTSGMLNGNDEHYWSVTNPRQN